MLPSASADEPRLRHVCALGVAQTLAWGSTYYLPAVLAAPMARDLGVGTAAVFAAMSLALLVAAAVGPLSGRAIDRFGGRPVLIATSLIFEAGLALLAVAQGPLGLCLAWVVIGIGMGSGLYEAAFATLVRLHGPGARRAITGITLIAGFASTVGWPLSALMEAQFGWRGACVGWAALHLLLGLPLNASLPGLRRAAAEPAGAEEPRRGTGPNDASNATSEDLGKDPGKALASTPPGAPAAAPSGTRSAVLLAFVFAVTWFVSTAMASHLPRLLQAGGATLAVAVGVGALIGPAQVAARLLDFTLLRRAHPLLSARLAALAHPVGVMVLMAAGAPAAAAFTLLHGAGNGILTIAKGTLPLVLFGPLGYGERQGWLMLPARMAQALAPWAFGLALDQWGVQALWLSGGLSLASFAALMLIRKTPGA